MKKIYIFLLLATYNLTIKTSDRSNSIQETSILKANRLESLESAIEILSTTENLLNKYEENAEEIKKEFLEQVDLLEKNLKRAITHTCPIQEIGILEAERLESLESAIEILSTIEILLNKDEEDSEKTRNEFLEQVDLLEQKFERIIAKTSHEIKAIFKK